MRLIRFLFIALALSCAPTAAQKPAVDASDYIRIDGSKNPELIPEYLVWQQALSGFALVKAKGIPLPPVLRNLPPAERERIFEAAVWHEQQAKECMERQQRKTEMLRSHKKPNWKAIDAVQKEVILECREELLEKVSVLLTKLSDEARMSLLAWAEESKGGIWARIAKGEFEFFRKPR